MNDSKQLIEQFKQAVETHHYVNIQDVPEEHRKVYAVWRQHLASVVLWYTQYSKNKDRSSSVNAAMALGKLSSVPKPTDFISELQLDELSLMCEDLWDALQHED